MIPQYKNIYQHYREVKPVITNILEKKEKMAPNTQ